MWTDKESRLTLTGGTYTLIQETVIRFQGITLTFSPQLILLGCERVALRPRVQPWPLWVVSWSAYVRPDYRDSALNESHYFWNGANNEHEPIEFHALTGIFERLEIEQKEFRGKPDYKINLHIRADRNYVIQAGYETLFAKGMLHTLSKLPITAFTKPITIAVEPGDTEQVLFCRIYNPVTGQSVFAPYPENTDWQQVTTRAITKIDSAHGRIEKVAHTA